MTWSRFFGSPDMHAIALLHATTVTAECRKTFPSYDAVESYPDPAQAERCDDCQRALVARKWVECGLRELREAAP